MFEITGLRYVSKVIPTVTDDDCFIAPHIMVTSRNTPILKILHCKCSKSTLSIQSWISHYENTPIQIYRKFHLQKLKIFRYKTSDIFHISAQNIDCGYSLEPPGRGSSNEYPQYMFLSRNNKNNVYTCKPQFYYIKVGFKGVKII